MSNLTNNSEYWSPNLGIYAEALTEDGTVSNSCGRVNIMGSIVQDAAPYLFPFIIEYSLIGAAVIYVMWKHIGRHPRWPHQTEADLERRLEAMLSRRAVALAHAGIVAFFLQCFRYVNFEFAESHMQRIFLFPKWRKKYEFIFYLFKNRVLT